MSHPQPFVRVRIPGYPGWGTMRTTGLEDAVRMCAMYSRIQPVMPSVVVWPIPVSAQQEVTR